MRTRLGYLRLCRLRAPAWLQRGLMAGRRTGSGRVAGRTQGRQRAGSAGLGSEGKAVPARRHGCCPIPAWPLVRRRAGRGRAGPNPGAVRARRYPGTRASGGGPAAPAPRGPSSRSAAPPPPPRGRPAGLHGMGRAALLPPARPWRRAGGCGAPAGRLGAAGLGGARRSHAGRHHTRAGRDAHLRAGAGQRWPPRIHRAVQPPPLAPARLTAGPSRQRHRCGDGGHVPVLCRAPAGGTGHRHLRLEREQHAVDSRSALLQAEMQLWYQLRTEELEHMQAAYFGFKGRNNNNNNKKLRNTSVFGDMTNMAYDNQGFYRSQEEQTWDIVVPECCKDNSHLLKVAKSSGAPGAHTVPRHNTALQTVNSIHIVEVYSPKDGYNKPTCQIPG